MHQVRRQITPYGVLRTGTQDPPGVEWLDVTGVLLTFAWAGVGCCLWWFPRVQLESAAAGSVFARSLRTFFTSTSLVLQSATPLSKLGYGQCYGMLYTALLWAPGHMLHPRSTLHAPFD